MGEVLQFPKAGAVETKSPREPQVEEERFLALADHLIAEVFCTEAPREKRPAAQRVNRVTKSA